jgi:hypothetical protein
MASSTMAERLAFASQSWISLIEEPPIDGDYCSHLELNQEETREKSMADPTAPASPRTARPLRHASGTTRRDRVQSAPLTTKKLAEYIAADKIKLPLVRMHDGAKSAKGAHLLSDEAPVCCEFTRDPIQEYPHARRQLPVARIEQGHWRRRRRKFP